LAGFPGFFPAISNSGPERHVPRHRHCYDPIFIFGLSIILGAAPAIVVIPGFGLMSALGVDVAIQLCFSPAEALGKRPLLQDNLVARL